MNETRFCLPMNKRDCRLLASWWNQHDQKHQYALRKAGRHWTVRGLWIVIRWKLS